MKEVTAYQTVDGKTFSDASEAARHEIFLGVREIVESEGFRGMDADDVAKIVVDKARDIHLLLGAAMGHLTFPTSGDDS